MIQFWNGPKKVPIASWRLRGSSSEAMVGSEQNPESAFNLQEIMSGQRSFGGLEPYVLEGQKRRFQRILSVSMEFKASFLRF